MTLIQAQDLGYAGEEIISLLNELRESAEKPEDFDDKDHQMEYIDDTISMIKTQLTKLQEK